MLRYHMQGLIFVCLEKRRCAKMTEKYEIIEVTASIFKIEKVVYR